MDMKQMMRQAQKMQKQLNEAQEELANMTFDASAGGGMVKATVAGDMTLRSIEISPAAVDPEDVEMLQDMVLAAVNEALRGMGELSEARLSAVTGGMNIPGMPGF